MEKKWALIILVATSTINAGKNTWKSPYQKNNKNSQVHSAYNSTKNRDFLNTSFTRSFYLPKPEIKYSAQSNQNEIDGYLNALQVEREYNERILRTTCANDCSAKSFEQKPSACHSINACTKTNVLTLVCALCFGQLDFSCKTTNPLGK